MEVCGTWNTRLPSFGRDWRRGSPHPNDFYDQQVDFSDTELRLIAAARSGNTGSICTDPVDHAREVPEWRDEWRVRAEAIVEICKLPISIHGEFKSMEPRSTESSTSKV